MLRVWTRHEGAMRLREHGAVWVRRAEGGGFNNGCGYGGGWRVVNGAAVASAGRHCVTRRVGFVIWGCIPSVCGQIHKVL